MSREAVERQLERLMVMVPWVMAHAEAPTVEEVCERFGISEPQLAATLDQLFVCGLHPFTPDTLIDAEIYDGQVWIRSADAFQRPPAFTASEALALVTAASAALAVPGNENNQALISALAKLVRVLGIDPGEFLEVELSEIAGASVGAVRDAAARRVRIELDYYSYGRNAWSHRLIEPYRVFNADGQWYLQGGVEGGEVRNFRIDRMRNVKQLDQTFELPVSLPEASTYSPRPEDPELTIEVDRAGRWITEAYPVKEAVAVSDEWTRVTLTVSEPVWAERLLLRMGEHVRVVAGDIDPAKSANRILERYRDDSDSSKQNREPA